MLLSPNFFQQLLAVIGAAGMQKEELEQPEFRGCERQFLLSQA
jgi:hypothetical protein